MDGHLRIDEAGRLLAVGHLRQQLQAEAGEYVLASSDGFMLSFQRVSHAPMVEECRAPIILQGDLGALHSSVDVINFMGAAKLSGSLVFLQGDTRKWLYFKAGEVIGAGSTDPEDRLGEVLYRYGILSREILDQATEECRRYRRPFGNYLLEKGVLSPNDLLQHVRCQVEEIVFSVILLKQGDFYLTSFDVEQLPSPISLNIQSLLMEGLQRSDELIHFRNEIPNDDIYFERLDAAAHKLTTKETLVLQMLDQPHSVDELMRLTHLGPFDTLKSLFGLKNQHLVRIIDPPSTSDPSGENGDIFGRVNQIFASMGAALVPRGQLQVLQIGLQTFLQFYGFADLFAGVGIDGSGKLDVALLAENLSHCDVPDRQDYLTRALRELLFFELFSIRSALSPAEQQSLQQAVDLLNL